MANNTHGVVRVEEGDLVYITTTPTTAMETTVAKTEDIVYRAGATVKQISTIYVCLVTLIRMTCN